MRFPADKKIIQDIIAADNAKLAKKLEAKAEEHRMKTMT